jgi:hypothetical protein
MTQECLVHGCGRTYKEALLLHTAGDNLQD